MSVSFEARDGVGVARVTGALTAANVDSFREQFTTWYRDAGVRNVVADLGAMDFMDSSGLGVLIAMLKRIGENGGDLKLVRLQQKVRMVFEITRAHRVFEIYDTVEEALKACR